MQLGLQRAREMRDAILLKAAGKVDHTRVHTGSRGQAEPTGDNDTEDGRAANRRVEFFFFVPRRHPAQGQVRLADRHRGRVSDCRYAAGTWSTSHTPFALQ
jgi:hypothetical protein